MAKVKNTGRTPVPQARLRMARAGRPVITGGTPLPNIAPAHENDEAAQGSSIVVDNTSLPTLQVSNTQSQVSNPLTVATQAPVATSTDVCFRFSSLAQELQDMVVKGGMERRIVKIHGHFTGTKMTGIESPSSFEGLAIIFWGDFSNGEFKFMFDKFFYNKRAILLRINDEFPDILHFTSLAALTYFISVPENAFSIIRNTKMRAIAVNYDEHVHDGGEENFDEVIRALRTFATLQVLYLVQEDRGILDVATKMNGRARMAAFCTAEAVRQLAKHTAIWTMLQNTGRTPLRWVVPTIKLVTMGELEELYQ